MFKTPNISKNRKTVWSVDFGICPLMSLNNNGSYISKKCPGCYSARLLNVYPDLKKKMKRIDGHYPNISDFRDDIKKIKGTGLRFIRFYSLGDFICKKDIEYIHAAADIMPVEMFSKTLHMKYRKYVPLVMSHTNIHCSFSMNKNFKDEYIEKFWFFLKDNNLLKNCQINYTFLGDEEVRHIKYISVYHTTKHQKLDLFNLLGYNRSCCAKDEDGNKIIEKNSGNTVGSCVSCYLCKLPATNKQSEILVPKLMREVYG